MDNTLIVIDGYLSTLERAAVCERLIDQVKQVRPESKILLLNKSGNSYGLEKKVEYYYNHGHSFMVGYPPQKILDTKEYSRPYVYFETDFCTLENWMPLVNVTDHVANIYNSYILSSRLSKTLGFDFFFRIEFDIDFDLDELKDIFSEINKSFDGTMFGLRKEGLWMGENQYLIDVHISGFSNRVFDNFELVNNDEEFWKVCSRVGYYGKWIEYLIPSLYFSQKKECRFLSKIDNTFVRKKYPKTKFDVISSLGEWTNKWVEIPKLCKVSNDNGLTEEENTLGIFFYNPEHENVRGNLQFYNMEDQLIHEQSFDMNKDVWSWFTVNIDDGVRIVSNFQDNNDNQYSYDTLVTKDNVSLLNCRMLVK